VPLGGGTLTPQATLLYSGAYQNTDFNTVLDEQGSFYKLDLRLGWRSGSGTYSAEAFVNNVTDEITLNRATFGSRGLNQSYDAPRMWGFRVGARF
jgi:iron complex outermembrane recepter protein